MPSTTVRPLLRVDLPRDAGPGCGRRLELTEHTAGPGFVRVETQWLVVDPLAPRTPVAAGDLRALLADVDRPGGSRATVDPRGRVAVSTPPQAAVDLASATATQGLHAVRHRLGQQGLGLVGLGQDPVRDRGATAAVHIGIGLDPDPATAARQQRVAADLGVVLGAACANSPLADDAPTGFRSTRLAHASAVSASDLVVVRRPGWLELRVVDALPEPFWRVPVAVAAAALTDPIALTRTERAAAYAAGRWADAARHGLAHPVLSHAARSLFDTALDALARMGVARETLNVVTAYAERFVGHDRTPADHVLAAWSAGTEPLLAAATLVATPVRRPTTAPARS
jgi:gamma-glutamylcysteine synthetase